MNYGSVLLRVVRVALRRPRLAWSLPGTAWRFRARDWYRRPPFLPVPPASYIAWRLHTAFGDDDHAPAAPVLEHYLDWVRRMRAPCSG